MGEIFPSRLPIPLQAPDRVGRTPQGGRLRPLKLLTEGEQKKTRRLPDIREAASAGIYGPQGGKPHFSRKNRKAGTPKRTAARFPPGTVSAYICMLTCREG